MAYFYDENHKLILRFWVQVISKKRSIRYNFTLNIMNEGVLHGRDKSIFKL